MLTRSGCVGHRSFWRVISGDCRLDGCRRNSCTSTMAAVYLDHEYYFAQRTFSSSRGLPHLNLVMVGLVGGGGFQELLRCPSLPEPAVCKEHPKAGAVSLYGCSNAVYINFHHILCRTERRILLIYVSGSTVPAKIHQWNRGSSQADIQRLSHPQEGPGFILRVPVLHGASRNPLSPGTVL